MEIRLIKLNILDVLNMVMSKIDLLYLEIKRLLIILVKLVLVES